MAKPANADWIVVFDKYLASALDPKAKVELKELYKVWVKNKGKLYSDLSSMWPELVELLNVIEKNIGLQINLETEKPENKDKEGK